MAVNFITYFKTLNKLLWKHMNITRKKFDMEKIDQILDSLYDRVIEPIEAKEQLLDLFAVIKSVCDECTAYPFDERGKTPLCKTCKDNPSQTVL